MKVTAGIVRVPHQDLACLLWVTLRLLDEHSLLLLQLCTLTGISSSHPRVELLLRLDGEFVGSIGTAVEACLIVEVGLRLLRLQAGIRILQPSLVLESMVGSLDLAVGIAPRASSISTLAYAGVMGA